MLRWIAKSFKGMGHLKSKTHEDRKLVRLGRDEYKYCEGDHALILQVEMLNGKPNRLIYSSTIKKWLPPHEDEAIEATRQREIAERIAALFEENGYSVEIQ
jgi:predicted transglutaminase-like protease